jgi:hypothetical protein
MTVSALCLLTAVLLALAGCDPFGDLQATPSSSMIQDVADYTFLLTFNGDGVNNYTVAAGSQLVIYFPA